VLGTQCPKYSQGSGAQNVERGRAAPNHSPFQTQIPQKGARLKKTCSYLAWIEVFKAFSQVYTARFEIGLVMAGLMFSATTGVRKERGSGALGF